MRNFVQVRQWLEHNFPELRDKITGEHYPPPPLVELLMKILSLVQLAGMAFVLLGTKVFSLLGMSYVPDWYETVNKNAIQIAIFVYLLLPQILSNQMVSGAFEIYLDGDHLIFSKIKTGRLPQYADLIDPLLKAGLKRAE